MRRRDFVTLVGASVATAALPRVGLAQQAKAAKVAVLSLPPQPLVVQSFPYSLDWPQSGALIGYGPDNAQIYRRAGYYINAILKGANPGDLAVELPTSFNLALNLKTAKALGLTVPPSLIGVATEVIE